MENKKINKCPLPAKKEMQSIFNFIIMVYINM